MRLDNEKRENGNTTDKDAPTVANTSCSASEDEVDLFAESDGDCDEDWVPVVLGKKDLTITFYFLPRRVWCVDTCSKWMAEQNVC